MSRHTVGEEKVMPEPAARLVVPFAGGRPLERIGGGSQTCVYRTADHRWVVKVKRDAAGSTRDALARAREMRAVAATLAACLGPEHSIPSHYVIARGCDGQVQILVVQPLVEGARPLHAVDLAALGEDERARVAAQLDGIVRRARRLYRTRGYMPDLYGISRAAPVTRAGWRLLLELPRRLTGFVTRQSLLRSHNLLLTAAPECRVVLVDYDLVSRNRLARRAHYAARWLQLGLDHLRIGRLRPRPNRAGRAAMTRSAPPGDPAPSDGPAPGLSPLGRAP